MVGMQPGEAFDPGARDLAIMLDDRGAFFLDLAPAPRCDRLGNFSRIRNFSSAILAILISLGWRNCATSDVGRRLC